MAVDKQLLLGSLKSRTVWFNAAVTAAGICTWVADHGILVKVLIPNAGPILAGIGIAGLALRYATDSSVRDKINTEIENTVKTINSASIVDQEGKTEVKSYVQGGDG